MPLLQNCLYAYYKPLKYSRNTRECRDSVAKNKSLTTQASLNHAFAGIHDPSKYKK
jgi:hypothetical protein